MLKITDNIKLGKLVGSSGNTGGSGGDSGSSQFPSDKTESIDTSSLKTTGKFKYTAPADGWFFIDHYRDEYNLYGNIYYNNVWLGNFTVGVRVDFTTKEVNVGGTIINEVERIYLEAGGEYQRIAVPKGAVISMTPTVSLNESSGLPNAMFIYSQNNS